jgi:SMODS and SLOG-associating 2TM effector domain family 4
MTGAPHVQPLRELVAETLTNISTTHKCHEKEREILESRARTARAANVILTALSSTGIVSVLLGAGSVAIWITAAVTFSSLAFTLWQLQFHPEIDAIAQKEAANDYVSLRNQCRALLTDIDLGHDRDKVRSQHNRILQDLRSATEKSPPTSPKAYRLVKSHQASPTGGISK